MEDYFDSIEIGDLNEKCKQYAALIGIDNLIKLCRKYGGSRIHIPKPDGLTKELIRKNIRTEYNGKNINYLAAKYYLSEKTIYRILKNQIKVAKAKPMDGQISLF